MNILSYVQARNEINGDLSENEIQRILTITGRAQEWIKPIGMLAIGGGTASDVAIIEQSGMGREILKYVPKEEWVYLINPSLASESSLVVSENIVSNGRIFSPAFGDWLMAQEIGTIYRLSQKPFTAEESRAMNCMWNSQETIVDREKIAVSLWGESWSTKYSDWGIDAIMHRVRGKIMGNWQLLTIKGRGYMLAGQRKSTQAPNLALKRGEMVQEVPGSIYPSDEYLGYMNDPKRVRKVYKDLFTAIKREQPEILRQKIEKILCINSYSYDNVDAVVDWIKENKWEGTKAYFVHYDPRAIDMHKARIKELGVESSVECFYDDLRESKLRDGSMDLAINDFRLNFNQDDKQNRAVVGHTRRILRDGGVALFSTVVDGRYENMRYGIDQEKAPINVRKPGVFQADEHLVRRCWSVPYYKQLFEKAGFRSVLEFDIEEGKRWGHQTTLSVNPWQGPFYRRWVVRK